MKNELKFFIGAIIFWLLIALAAQPVLKSFTSTATPTNTPTATSTNTPTATSTNTPTATPTNTPTATPTATPTVMPTVTPTVIPTVDTSIIDVATNARQFEILLLALSLANLTDGLKGAGPFTLFAPADAAFASLPNKTLDHLIANPAEMARVLQFHVVPQKLSLASITDGLTVDTLMGQKLTFAVSGGKVTVNGVTINATELPATNGSIMIIEAVLIPPD